MKYSILISGLVFCFVFYLGCNKSPIKTVPVSATVQYNGAAVEGALVTFNPIDKGPENRSASGMTDASGIVKPLTPPGVKGVVPGKYKVTIMKTPTIGGSGKDAPAAPPPQSYDEALAASQNAKQTNMKVDARHQLPVKYASSKTTDLEADVVGPKALDLTFELKD